MSINVCNNNSLSAITSIPASITGSALTLLETQTASSSATISFTSNIDSTYKEYIFKYINVHPATNSTMFAFQVDTGTNTSYNQTITSTHFTVGHNEAGNDTLFTYQTSMDQAQGTSFQKISNNVGNGNDECVSGTLHLFDPSSTTFVKHFVARSVEYHNEDYAIDSYTGGYINTTTAITRVQFKFESGNIDSGTFKLYGVS
jgi:hypothetical protein|tara:strand:+ start:438 stop:1043 length:606 start_codon:yes stop_codon:yes gene_type:complete